MDYAKTSTATQSQSGLRVWMQIQTVLSTVELRQQPIVKTRSGPIANPASELAQAPLDQYTKALQAVVGNIEKLRSAVTWMGDVIAFSLLDFVFK